MRQSRFWLLISMIALTASKSYGWPGGAFLYSPPSSGGGASPSLQNPATGFLNMNGSMIGNSTGDYVNNGSISVGSTVPKALIHVSTPADNPGIDFIFMTTGTNSNATQPLFQVNSSTFLALSATGYFPANSVIGGTNPWTTGLQIGNGPGHYFGASGAGTDVQPTLFLNPASPLIALQGVSGGAKNEFNIRANGGPYLVGTNTNHDITFVANGGNRMQIESNTPGAIRIDLGQNLYLGWGGGSEIGSSMFDEAGGSATIRSKPGTSDTCGLIVGTTQFIVHSKRPGGVAIGTNTPTETMFLINGVSPSTNSFVRLSANTTIFYDLNPSTFAVIPKSVFPGGVAIGTNAPPTAALEVRSMVSLSSYIVTISSSPDFYQVAVTTNGMFSLAGGSPTVSSCGSVPNGSLIKGSNQVGVIQIGGGVTTSCTLSFGPPFNVAPVCVISDNSTTIPGDITSITNTTLTMGFSGSVANALLYYICIGNKE